MIAAPRWQALGLLLCFPSAPWGSLSRFCRTLGRQATAELGENEYSLLVSPTREVP